MQTSESSPVRDRRSTTEPPDQHRPNTVIIQARCLQMQQQCADCLLFESLTSRLLRLRPDREGIIKMSSGVCPSVCRVPQHNSRTERPTKPKFAGWKPFTRVSHKPIYLKVKRLKVNVTKPINAHTVNAKYLLNGKAYELQTWCTDGARRPASPRSKVKSQGHVTRLIGVGQ